MQKQNSDFPNTLIITHFLVLELLTHKEGIKAAESIPAEGLWKSFIFHCLEEREMLLYWKFTHFPGSVLSSPLLLIQREESLIYLVKSCRSLSESRGHNGQGSDRHGKKSSKQSGQTKERRTHDSEMSLYSKSLSKQWMCNCCMWARCGRQSFMELFLFLP